MGWLRMSKFLEFVAAAALALALPSAASAAGDAASGEQVFKRCTACHAVGEDAKNKVGPQLTGVVGRAAGTVEGFKRSEEHTYELQSLMRTSYAVFCLKKK